MHKFRMRLLATAAILTMSGAAYAADLAVKAPPPVAPAPVTNWTGFYVGAQVGGASFDPSCHTGNVGGFALSDFGLDPCFASSGEGIHSGGLSSGSVLGGGRIGYDYQWGKVVWGVVGQFDWTHLDGTATTANSFGTGSVLSANETINWLASARGRVGWAFDNVLFYATAGVAWTQIKASTGFVEPFDAALDFAGQTSSDKTGAVAGGGFEYRVTPNVSFVGELLWYGFGTTTVNAPSDFIIGNVVKPTITTQFTNQDILAGTLGVNYRF